VPQHFLEQSPRFFAAPQRGESVDVPEGANQERILRRSENVLLRVSVDEISTLEIALDRGHRPGEAGIVGGEESDLV
jgi:hypothetical protein